MHDPWDKFAASSACTGPRSTMDRKIFPEVQLVEMFSEVNLAERSLKNLSLNRQQRLTWIDLPPEKNFMRMLLSEPGKDFLRKWNPQNINRGHQITGKNSTKLVEKLINKMDRGEWPGGPLKVVLHEGEYYLLDGHHRLAAAKRLNIKVPIDVIEDIRDYKCGWSTIEEFGFR